MKAFHLFLVSLLFVTGAFAQVDKIIPSRPNPPKLVNDIANILTEEQEHDLERKLVAYDDSTSNQIAVVTVPGLEGYSADEYAVGLGRKWGVGGKEFNNGVVILISTGGAAGDRDVFIAPGYGLEGRVTDQLSKSIVEDVMIPNLRNAEYYRAVDDAVDAIVLAAAGRYKAPENYRSKNKGRSYGKLIFIAILLIIWLSSRGGKGGGMVSRRGYRGWMGPTIFPTGGFGGGSGGGFGGGGGGFGGFGGGGFGGGGAGGKW